jgi:hypothetical protein
VTTVQIQRWSLTFLTKLLIIGRNVAFSVDDRGQPQLLIRLRFQDGTNPRPVGQLPGC